jgi:hypothetical protein
MRGILAGGIAAQRAAAETRSASSNRAGLPSSGRSARSFSGVDDIVVVVGCQADRVRRVCGHRITQARTGDGRPTVYFWMVRALLYEGFVVLNCDVLFHPVLLGDLLSARHDNALLLAYREADQPPFGDEEMKVKVRCGRVVEMSKQLDAEEADGENLGIVKFGPEGAAALVDIMDRLIAAGGLRDWAPRAFSEFARIGRSMPSARAAP